MTLYYYKDLTEKFKNRDFYSEYKQCKLKQDNKEKQDCLWSLLHDITELQDHIQLAIPIVEKEDNLAKQFTDCANAVILETSETNGGLRGMFAGGYVNKKIKCLDEALWELNLKYKKED